MTSDLESTSMTAPARIDNKVQKFSGAVILLDRLGTKGIWKDNPERALGQWNFFRKGLLEIEKDMMMTSEISKKYGYVSEIETLSDTIIWLVRLNISDPYAVLKMANASVAGMVNFAFTQDVFLRGCISIGEYYKTDSGASIIGPAVDEAAQYYERPLWIGVSLAPSAHLVVREKPDLEDFNFHKYDIPLNDGIERNGIAIDWVNRFHPEGPGKIREKLIEMMMKTADVDVAFKYRNTLDFVEMMMKKSKN